MKDDGKEVVGRGSPDVERELGRLEAAPVPAGLRGRVLDRAFETRANATLTPATRVLAIACSIAIVGAVAADPLLGRHEAARLAAVLDGRSPVRQEERTPPELAEVLAGDENAAERLAKLQVLAASAARAVRPIPIFEVRERLKGWLNDEDPEDPD